MTYEEKKISKIVQEMNMYFFSIGADFIQSEIDKGDKNVVITFKANYKPEHEETISELDEYLNCLKNDGIEDVYWEIAGSGASDESSQMLLIGMMIDEAEIRLEDGFVYLTLIREMLE